MTAGARDAGGGGRGVLLLNGRGNGHVILIIKMFKRKKKDEGIRGNCGLIAAVKKGNLVAQSLTRRRSRATKRNYLTSRC